MALWRLLKVLCSPSIRLVEATNCRYCTSQIDAWLCRGRARAPEAGGRCETALPTSRCGQLPPSWIEAMIVLSTFASSDSSLAAPIHPNQILVHWPTRNLLSALRPIWNTFFMIKSNAFLTCTEQTRGWRQIPRQQWAFRSSRSNKGLAFKKSLKKQQ